MLSVTIFHCSYTSVFLPSLPRTDGTHSGKVLGDGVGVSDLYYCNAHSLCGGQKGLKTEGFFKFIGGCTGVSFIQTYLPSLCCTKG